jgi:putative protease
MIKSRKDIELMAPAGSYESLMSAIKAGADSVYFGIQHLNMRATSSSNFNFEDMTQIVQICDQYKIKCYLTLNTILYDHDLGIMQKIIDAAAKAGVSAIIASDQAAIFAIREKEIELHLSTQLNISNIESLKFYANWADVVVLARELNLTQVSKIYEAIHEQQIKGPSEELIRIEMFAHGALCMAVSGKCYMSLHEMNSSANRGACLQTCRKPYIVTEKETGNELEIDNEYIMSPKDLSTIHFLNKIIDAGVRVLKIEGRARPPEYVDTVVSCYDEAIRSLADGSYSVEKINEWKQRLSSVFNRGFWDGYYLGQKLGEWSHIYGSQATKKKVYIGKGTNYFQKIGVAEFLIETGNLEPGDEILITGPTTGVIRQKVKEIRVDDKIVSQTVKGERFSMLVDEIVRRSDKIYKVVDTGK